MKNMLLVSTAILGIPAAFMNDFCPVVKVVMNGQEVRINKSDYDENPGNYTLVDGEDGSGTDPRIETYTVGGVAPLSLGDKVGAQGSATIGALMAEPDAGEPVVYTAEQLAMFAAFQPGVMTKKKVSYVVDQTRDKDKPVDDIPGIDPNGYDSPDTAWRIAFETKQKLTPAPATPGAGGGDTSQT